MPVQNTPENVGNRLFHIRPGDQNAENTGDIPLPHLSGAGAFTQGHDQVRGGRWVPPQCRHLARSNRNLAVGFGKTGDRVRQKKHVSPLIAEMFRHRHGRPCTAPPHKRRLIRGRGDHDRMGQPLFAEDIFDKIAQFAPAFTNQGDHHDVGLHLLCKPPHQAGFPDTRPGEKPKPLAPHDWKNRIEHRHSSFESPAHGPPRRRRRRAGLERAWFRPTQQRRTIQRHPIRIDNPPDPRVGWCDPGLMTQGNPIADRNPVRRGVGQYGQLFPVKLDDLAGEQGAIAQPDTQNISDAARRAQTTNAQQIPFNRANPTDLAHRACKMQLCPKRGNIQGSHAVLQFVPENNF